MRRFEGYRVHYSFLPRYMGRFFRGGSCNQLFFFVFLVFFFLFFGLLCFHGSNGVIRAKRWIYTGIPPLFFHGVFSFLL